MSSRLSFLLSSLKTVAAPFLIFVCACIGLQKTEAQLSVTLTPAEWKVNQTGILQILIRAEKGRLRKGSRIALSFPGSWTWHAIHPIETDGKLRIPTRVPSEELSSYFSVLTTDKASRWKLEIMERHFDGTYHRFDREVVLSLLSGELARGESVVLRYGNDVKPIKASRLAETVSIRGRLDLGDGEWQNLGNSAFLKTLPDQGKTIIVTIPSQGRILSPIRVHLSSRDRFGNAAKLPRDLELRCKQNFSTRTALSTNEEYYLETSVEFRSPGFYTVEGGNKTFGFYPSNPILVSTDDPKRRLYWGDLHSHSSMSKDGIGSDSFTFARNCANLDFFASTEHSSGDKNDEGITETEWNTIQDKVSSFYEPGRFVTLLAYECSLPTPYGHHNVYYDSDRAPLYRENEVKSLDELWRRLSKHRAFTVPHHTGVHWAPATWENNTSALRPLIEIFSVHGQSEQFDPDNPLSYDQMIGTAPYGTYPKSSPTLPEEYRNISNDIAVISTSAKGPHYARDAWSAGLELGTIASSDDHTARPGQPYWGLAAVWCEQLDRKSIFEALLKRQTYGTTGQRIYLDVSVNNQLPGSKVVPKGSPHITVQAYGTAAFEWVEIVKFDGRTRTYSTLKRWMPRTAYVKETVLDRDFVVPAFYYIRLKQRGFVDGRPVMAWSSPIWLVDK